MRRSRGPYPYFAQLPPSGWPRAAVSVPAASAEGAARPVLRTCKNCKQQYDPSVNHPSACRYHTAHFGGETNIYNPSNSRGLMF